MEYKASLSRGARASPNEVCRIDSCAIDSLLKCTPETINLDSAQDCRRKVSVGCYYYLEETVIYDLHCLVSVKRT